MTLFPQLQPSSDPPPTVSYDGPFAAVALEQSVDRELDYAVPPRLVSQLRVGQRVRVPLGRNNKPAKGYVVAIRETTTYPKIKRLTDILVTHIHPDHTGGLTIGGKMIFPNATVHVNKRELDFWTDGATGDNYPEPTKGFYKQVGPTVGPYVAAGHVKTFEGATELFPEIRTLPATVTRRATLITFSKTEVKSSSSWAIRSTPDAQFDDPDITIEFDVDQKQAAATRRGVRRRGPQRLLVALTTCTSGIGRLLKERPATMAYDPTSTTREAFDKPRYTRKTSRRTTIKFVETQRARRRATAPADARDLDGDGVPDYLDGRRGCHHVLCNRCGADSTIL
jgi:hypothetical protein